MRRARTPDTDETPGGDSFLDIVANIVGILVLLVVVIGVRASREVFVATEQRPTEELESVEELRKQTLTAIGEARSRQRELRENAENALATSLESQRRERERAEGVHYVTKLRAELDEAREVLTMNDRETHDTHNALAQAQITLDRLTAEQIALASVEPEPDVETVVVAPTPIVDGKADRTISFRLKGDRLVYVPVNEIEVELAKSVRLPTLTDPTKTVITHETVGPIEGFRGEADLAWRVRSRGGRVGVTSQVGRLILREATPLRGESLDTAFGQGGYVDSRLGLLNPENFVVRLIVYADSFESSNEASQKFRERGFRVAQSLKSDGAPIGFSSSGYQAVTQ
ncbi:hypothetical protein MalM25_22560 [Planctomycetes bacterium MalM25]|nr:hypothetical protein MalM25_22560 [Planctomycetes bacterium MalM25]